MSDVDKAIETLLGEFVESDRRRKEDVFGTKRGEQALMRLCEFMKGNDKLVSEATRAKTLAALQGMNLLPYRSYCREHLLDIGITNV